MNRVKGNREPIGAVLQDFNGSAIDLTGKTVSFRMVGIPGGTVKVNDQSVTIVTATDGKVSYAPAAADVDTVGQYAMYFQDDSTTVRRWPYDGATFTLRIIDEQDK